MSDFVVPLTWGLTIGQIKEKLKHFIGPEKDMYFSASRGRLTFGNATLTNFEGDCGALYLQGANSVSKQDLECIKEFCSLSGFSKVFATVVSIKSVADKQENLFHKAGWVTIKRGHSNRNPKKHDIALFLSVDCSYKGY